MPIAVIAWDEQQPGHFEADLVYHLGPATAGHYVHSLQMIDVATGWSEPVAMLGRSYRVMKDGFRRILTRRPFPLQHVHSDNGGEFINDHMRSVGPTAHSWLGWEVKPDCAEGPHFVNVLRHHGLVGCYPVVRSN